MLFNSFEFLVFLPLVFALYWFFSKRLELQNFLIVVCSYVFYSWWSWRFLFLILFTTISSYTGGLLIERAKGKKTRQKTVCLFNAILNLSILGVFKYYNFFVENFIDLMGFIGLNFHLATLHLILPIGISFYTFQALSYTIDVYKGKVRPSHNPLAFFAFLGFFPQLVAGPIERAESLLPQFEKKRIFSWVAATDGLRQMLWGFFKKIVIADNCATIVSDVFDNYTSYSGSTLALAAVFFSFQIYCDFSGYSDIAIGCGRLFGINLMQNFSYPYFSRNVAEFWRRWHISLTRWFRDYVYIPLGGSRVSQWKVYRNTFIVFLISGFWHGANWTFIAWGAYNALLFFPLLLTHRNRKYRDNIAEDRLLPNFWELCQMGSTFILVTIGRVIYRTNSIEHTWQYFSRMFSSSFFSVPKFYGYLNVTAMFTLAFIALMLVFEWQQRTKKHGLEIDTSTTKLPARVLLYSLLLFMIYYFGADAASFIYFQF